MCIPGTVEYLQGNSLLYYSIYISTWRVRAHTRPDAHANRACRRCVAGQPVGQCFFSLLSSIVTSQHHLCVIITVHTHSIDNPTTLTFTSLLQQAQLTTFSLSLSGPCWDGRVSSKRVSRQARPTLRPSLLSLSSFLPPSSTTNLHPNKSLHRTCHHTNPSRSSPLAPASSLSSPVHPVAPSSSALSKHHQID